MAYFEHTSPKPIMGLCSASLSLQKNNVSNRYIYPAYHTTVVANHPLSRLHSSVRGPILSRPRS